MSHDLEGRFAVKQTMELGGRMVDPHREFGPGRFRNRAARLRFRQQGRIQ